jgi:uncharacterized protein (DUF433 family)
VKRVLYILAEGTSREGICRDFPRLEDDDIRQALLYAADSVEERT